MVMRGKRQNFLKIKLRERFQIPVPDQIARDPDPAQHSGFTALIRPDGRKDGSWLCGTMFNDKTEPAPP